MITTTTEISIELTRIKKAFRYLDVEPVIYDPLMKLLTFASDYYHHPLGDVIAHAMPKMIREGKPLHQEVLAKILVQNKDNCPILSKKLNAEQEKAKNEIIAYLKHFKIFALQGITGSGKTEVYISVIIEVIKQGGQALVLVPEIGLTPQTLNRFEQVFGKNVLIYHSGLTEKTKLNNYSKAYFREKSIIIGTRSSLFLSMPNLSIIIVDEEQDSSYKQQEGFRYHARDLAVKYANILNIPIVLGSATPSLETYKHLQTGHYQKLSLSKRAIHHQKTFYNLIDLRNEKIIHGLSESLIEKMAEHLAKEKQILLFRNRRGFAPVMMCFQCGHHMECEQCSSYLVYHQNLNKMLCHHCLRQFVLPPYCPKCMQCQMMPVGAGTERLEYGLSEIFPEIPIIRFDKDTVRSSKQLEDKLNLISTGQKQIIIGTQILAKGHDLPNLTLVGIVDLDVGFLSIDYRSIEKTGQLLLQVAGRAGRHESSGEVWIQTRMPNHPLLQLLLQQDYDEFAKEILKQREVAKLPPFYFAALIRAESLKYEDANNFLQDLKNFFQSFEKPIKEILGPVNAIIEKKSGRHRLQLMLISEHRSSLHWQLNQAVEHIRQKKIPSKLRWSLDVDPVDLY